MIRLHLIQHADNGPAQNRLGCFILCLSLIVCSPGGLVFAANNGSILKALLPSPAITYSFSTSFEGNTFFTPDELLAAAQAELQLFETAQKKRSAVDDAAFQMELAYRAAGFPGAEVDYRIEERQGQYELHFSIVEGLRVLVQTVTFEGHDSFDESNLLGLNQKLKNQQDRHEPFPYVSQQMKGFARNLSDFYLAEGYLDVVVDQPQLIAGPSPDKPSSVLIRIFEGEKYLVGVIVFESDEGEDLQAELQEFSAALRGLPYNPRLKLLLQNKIQEYYQNIGYADVSMSISTQKRHAHAAVDLNVAIIKGETATIQEIAILGNQYTNESFIRKKIKTAVGQLYTSKDEKESFSALYQTGLFAKVDFKLEQMEQPGQKKLLIEVEEKQAKELFIEPGWGSYELLRVTSGYTDKNFFGTGKSFRFEGAASSKARQLSAGFTDPNFLEFPISADIPIYYRYREEPEYTIEETGLAIFFSEKFSNKARLSTGYSYSAKAITDIAINPNPLYLDNNYNNAAVTMTLSRDTRDDFFLPKSGYRGHVSLEYADTVLGGDLAYLRFTSGVRIFRTLSECLVLAMRYNTGFILPGYGQRGIPVDERFFTGGENSVRSFRESQLGPKDQTGASIGGTGFNTVSIELRQSFTDRLAGTVFFDTGNISPNKTVANGLSPLAADRQDLIDATWKDFFDDFRYGVGCGLQYLLPIGPARIDFGYNPDRRPDTEKEYALHLSIGMAF